MTQLTINPEWVAAEYSLHVISKSGQDCSMLNHHAPRFKAADLTAALKAMAGHDHETLNRLAIRKYIEAD